MNGKKEHGAPGSLVGHQYPVIFHTVEGERSGNWISPGALLSVSKEL